LIELKTRLAVLLASPKGKAMVEDGMKFSIEELQAAAFAQVLAEANDDCQHRSESALKPAD
jgi:hypothetical protein